MKILVWVLITYVSSGGVHELGPYATEQSCERVRAPIEKVKTVGFTECIEVEMYLPKLEKGR